MFGRTIRNLARARWTTLAAAMVLLLSSPAGGSGGQVTGAPDSPDLRVLFVGNSLTYQNDLPDIVTGRSPVGLPPAIEGGSGTRIDLGPERAALIQDAAAEANARFGRS